MFYKPKSSMGSWWLLTLVVQKVGVCTPVSQQYNLKSSVTLGTSNTMMIAIVLLWYLSILCGNYWPTSVITCTGTTIALPEFKKMSKCEFQETRTKLLLSLQSSRSWHRVTVVVCKICTEYLLSWLLTLLTWTAASRHARCHTKFKTFKTQSLIWVVYRWFRSNSLYS